MHSNDPGLDYKFQHLINAIQKLEDFDVATDLEIERRKTKRAALRENLKKRKEELEVEVLRAIEKFRRKDQATINKLTRELKAAQKAQPAVVVSEASKVNETNLKRAKTLAILDSILFAIENWATDDSPAPDFTLAAQATLFPLVYEQVGKGNEDYYIESVPCVARELVRRGREYILAFRKMDDVSILQPESWAVISGEIHDWWVKDALPLLYGARDDDWEITMPYSLEDMMKWQKLPAARPLEFPLIYDGMELVKEYGDQIRQTTGLAEFSKQMLETRITAHE